MEDLNENLEFIFFLILFSVFVIIIVRIYPILEFIPFLISLLIPFISLLGLYSFFIEPNFLLSTTYVDLGFTSLPKPFEGFRIVQLTDLHFGSSLFPFIYILVINKVMELHPDIIVVTGDLVSSKHAISQAVSFVDSLSKIAPTYIVFGNGDHREGLKAYNFLFSKAKLLLNLHTFIQRGDSKICLAGVDDPYSGFDNLEKAIPKDNSFKILLAHSPQIIEKARGKVDIVLAGHTHGGQVYIPFIGGLFVPLPQDYKKYVYGSFFENSTYMFVSRGIGVAMLYPVRLFCPPEIVVLTLY